MTGSEIAGSEITGSDITGSSIAGTTWALSTVATTSVAAATVGATLFSTAAGTSGSLVGRILSGVRSLVLSPGFSLTLPTVPDAGVSIAAVSATARLDSSCTCAGATGIVRTRSSV